MNITLNSVDVQSLSRCEAIQKVKEISATGNQMLESAFDNGFIKGYMRGFSAAYEHINDGFSENGMAIHLSYLVDEDAGTITTTIHCPPPENLRG